VSDQGNVSSVVEKRWTLGDNEACWCVIEEGKVYGFGPGILSEQSARGAVSRGTLSGYNETPDSGLVDDVDGFCRNHFGRKRGVRLCEGAHRQ
jgi:hypothetical protein